MRYDLNPTFTIAGPAAGYLAERYGIRMVTITGAVLGSIGTFLSMFASNLLVLYVTLGFITGTLGREWHRAKMVLITHTNHIGLLESSLSVSMNKSIDIVMYGAIQLLHFWLYAYKPLFDTKLELRQESLKPEKLRL